MKKNYEEPKRWFGGSWSLGEYVLSSSDDEKDNGRSMFEILDAPSPELVVVFSNGGDGLFSDGDTDLKDGDDMLTFMKHWNDDYSFLLKQKYRMANNDELKIISRYHDNAKVVGALVKVDMFKTDENNFALERMKRWLANSH